MKDVSILVLRIIAAWRLLAGTWPFIIQGKSYSGVQDFFASIHLPLPNITAYISVIAQFVCGILFLVGFWIKPASILMIINFSIAIIVVHLNDPIIESFAAWALWGVSIFFLANGAGKFSANSLLR